VRPTRPFGDGSILLLDDRTSGLVTIEAHDGGARDAPFDVWEPSS
jgi:hypothetical protein